MVAWGEASQVWVHHSPVHEKHRSATIAKSRDIGPVSVRSQLVVEVVVVAAVAVVDTAEAEEVVDMAGEEAEVAMEAITSE